MPELDKFKEQTDLLHKTKNMHNANHGEVIYLGMKLDRIIELLEKSDGKVQNVR